MIQYKIKYFDIPVPKPHKRAYLDFVDEKYDGITFLINDNLTTDLDWEYSIVNKLKKVLSGELEPQNTGTNRTSLEINKETTTIIDHFWGEETMDFFSRCSSFDKRFIRLNYLVDTEESRFRN